MTGTSQQSSQFHFCIVTPSFNQALFIRQTIASVLDQKVPTTYWVMDGGSRDKTPQILKKYQKKLDWESKKDHGQADAINKGIRKFRAQLQQKNTIFAYINSDDYYLPNSFQQVVAAFRQNPKKQWLVGECQIINAQNKKTHSGITLYKNLLRQIYFPSLLYILNPLPQPAVFMRGTAVQKIGLFNDQLHYVMDYEYWLRLQKKFGSPLFLPQELAAFRIHHDSKGGVSFKQQFTEQLKVVRRFSQNPILLLLHQMHNVITVAVYQVIKS